MRGDASGQYDAGVFSNLGPTAAWLAGSGPRAFDPGTQWHTYRVEAKNNTLRLLVDGVAWVERTGPFYPPHSGPVVGLWTTAAQVNVRAFRLIAL